MNIEKEGTVQYNVRFPKHVRDRIELIPKGRRAKFIIEAVESSLNFQDQSIERLHREGEELKQKLKINESLIKQKTREIKKQDERENIIEKKNLESVNINILEI